MDDIPPVEDIVGINIFKHDIDFIDGARLVEVSQRSIEKYEKKVQLIQYNSHICYVDNIHSSRLSAVQIAVHILKSLETWSVTWLDAVND